MSEAPLMSHLELSPGEVEKGGSPPSLPPHSWGEKDSGRRTPCFRYLRDRVSDH